MRWALEGKLAVAVIPARGGSKRIPRKNVKPFRGKPIIAYSIEAALRSGQFDKVLVTTDDEEIADTALAHGAHGVLPREGYLAGDKATLGEVMSGAVTELGGDDPYCCILATAPLVQPEDIIEGRKMLEPGWDFVFSATEYAFPVHRSLLQRPDGGVEMLFPQHRLTRSQDLPTVIHDAGQFYWGTADAWRSMAPIFSDRARPVLLPRIRVVDIDTPEDWEIAERLAELAY